jgi:flavin reductase (DIM6/NTAB) family NADH-FMN oxidoreductase RutF
MMKEKAVNVFNEIDKYEFACRPFQLIERNWTMIIVPDGENANPMTANWGGIGVLWWEPVVFTFVRPQRFTHGLLDRTDRYSVAVFDERYRDALAACGRESGRDVNKIEKYGWTLRHDNGVPYFDEACLVFLCRKLAKQPLETSSFIDPALAEKAYPGGDNHDLFIAGIEKILTRAEKTIP